MIEIPRAALTADKVAKEAEFFSFGTNDLTQTTMGLSRDDYTKFQKDYEKEKIFKADPFAVLDQEGVGKLVEMAVEAGRKARPDLEVGICGEHGGEPSSVAVLLQGRHGLRFVLPLSRADRPAGRGAGRDYAGGESRVANRVNIEDRFLAVAARKTLSVTEPRPRGTLFRNSRSLNRTK